MSCKSLKPQTSKTQELTSPSSARTLRDLLDSSMRRKIRLFSERYEPRWRNMGHFGSLKRMTILLIALTATGPCDPKPAFAQEIKPETVNKIVNAIYKAEGGAKTKYPYGIKSVRCTTEASCRKVTVNTVRNNFKRWEKAGNPGLFLHFLADRYCPPSVDPIGNRNWKVNVTKLAGA